MTNVLVIGASSRIALWADPMLVNDPDVNVTLFVRQAQRLGPSLQTQNIITGDATNLDDVSAAVKGQDIVYASLAGEVVKQAQTIVKAMDANNVKRLLWTSSLGIYDEVPGKFGEWNKQILGDYLTKYRQAADIITASDLDYTIIWPAWLTDDDESDYEVTRGDEPFKGTEVSRRSVAEYAVSLINDPTKDKRESVGLDKANTEGDKPRAAILKADGISED